MTSKICDRHSLLTHTNPLTCARRYSFLHSTNLKFCDCRISEKRMKMEKKNSEKRADIITGCKYHTGCKSRSKGYWFCTKWSVPGFCTLQSESPRQKKLCFHPHSTKGTSDFSSAHLPTLYVVIHVYSQLIVKHVGEN